MDLSTEKQRPQLVEVVNNSANPPQVLVSNLPILQVGDSQVLSTQVRNQITIQALRPQSGNFNLTLDNILLLQSDGTFVPIPLCSFLSNMTATNLNNVLLSFKTAYATLVSGVTAATLHYSKMTSNGVVTSEVYNLKD